MLEAMTLVLDTEHLDTEQVGMELGGDTPICWSGLGLSMRR